MKRSQRTKRVRRRQKCGTNSWRLTRRTVWSITQTYCNMHNCIQQLANTGGRTESLSSFARHHPRERPIRRHHCIQSIHFLFLTGQVRERVTLRTRSRASCKFALKIRTKIQRIFGRKQASNLSPVYLLYPSFSAVCSAASFFGLGIEES